MKNLHNKVIWITGASSGIGEALALELQKNPCKLILSARRKTVLEQVKTRCKHPDNIAILPLDLADTEQATAVVQKAWELFGRIDILVNNAGVSQRSFILETKMEVYAQLMHINYLGTVALTKALLPKFINQQSGQFVTVTSLMGKFGSPVRSGYCGAKHALHGFFDVLRMEHEKDGIVVTMICPGFVQTDVAKNAFVGDGSKQGVEDHATENGMPTVIFAKKMARAIAKKKFEAYIGGKEVLGVYVKRFFPKLLHKMVLRSRVR